MPPAAASAVRTLTPSPSQASNTAILYVYVAVGGVLGSLARYLASLLILPGSGFPWATLFVNITGSFTIGLYSALSGPDGRLYLLTDSSNGRLLRLDPAGPRN